MLMLAHIVPVKCSEGSTYRVQADDPNSRRNVGRYPASAQRRTSSMSIDSYPSTRSRVCLIEQMAELKQDRWLCAGAYRDEFLRPGIGSVVVESAVP